MSTFATLPPSMARLFRRVDSAEPSQTVLQAGFRHWQAKRRREVLPAEQALADVPTDLETNAFLFARLPATRDWKLRFAGAAARALMQPASERRELSAFADRRLAVRLRLLFAAAAETGEPLSAAFEVGRKAERRWVDVLACPLRTEGGEAGAIFGVILARPEQTVGARRVSDAAVHSAPRGMLRNAPQVKAQSRASWRSCAMLDREELRRLCGDVAEWKIAAIADADASLEDVEAAVAWAAGESDVMGEARRPVSGPVARVYDILMAEEEAWGGDREAEPSG